MDKFVNQIFCCDCVAGMKKLPDGCIPLTLTSPPYDGLRKYGGHTFDFEAVAKEVYRITMPGGIVVWIVQDQVVDGGETGTSFKQALYFRNIGFRLHSTMLMVSNGSKLPHRIRYVPLHQYAFVLSKGRPRYTNLIRDRRNTTKAKRKKWHARRENGEVISGHQSPRETPSFSERGNVWHYNVGFNQTTKDKDAFEHPALMADAMAEDHILSWSRPGDLVFDPFCGAGTTCKMALVNDRRYLGMEIHKPYHKLAIKRIDDARAEHRQKLDGYFSPPEPMPMPMPVPPSDAVTNRRINCRTSIKQGDVVAVSQKMDANIFDGCLFDGPYGLTSIGKRSGKRGSKPSKTDAGFMHQAWDGDVPSTEACQEFLRVCKPGSWMVAFGHPRTFHRLMCHIEDASWEIRDTLMWLYGTGFPKSHDLGKKMEDDAWKGYGFALKPAYEPIILAMKPLDGSFANNARKWGVAGLNIDGCRIPCTEKATFPSGKYDNADMFGVGAVRDGIDRNPTGRFPANVMLDEGAARLLDLQSPINKGGKHRKSGKRDRRHKGQQLYGGGIGGGEQNSPDCYGDAGGASRFFYCPKTSHRERNAGLEDFPIDRPDKRDGKGLGIWDEKGIQPQQNHHPCVKPIALNEWLGRLILPPKRPDPRRLLVPYSGTGSEMIGAMFAGWDEVVGIEQDKTYIDIARARIKWWRSHR